jgi:tol-pal system protein YbgF
MKQKELISLFAVVVISVAGCALQKDVYSLEERQGQLERWSQRMEEQIGSPEQIKSQIKDAIKGSFNEIKKLRAQYAGIKAEVDNLHDEVSRLRGSLEEAQYNKTKNKDEVEELNKSVSQKVVILTQDLEQAKKRLTQMEVYLDIKEDEKKGDFADNQEIDTDQTMYAVAKDHYDQGRMKEAREGFETFLKAYPKSKNADNAQFWIGETYYQQKWYEKAILEYQKVIENYPKDNKVPAALLKQAFSFQKINDKSNAKLILKELAQKYPSSNEGKLAAQKLKGL